MQVAAAAGLCEEQLQVCTLSDVLRGQGNAIPSGAAAGEITRRTLCTSESPAKMYGQHLRWICRARSWRELQGRLAWGPALALPRSARWQQWSAI